MALPMFPPDKVQHAAYGAIAASLSASAALFMPVTPREAAQLAFGAAAAAGAAKEAYDWWDNHRRGLILHQVAWLDFVATVFGAAPVVLPLLLIHMRGLP